jgi:hypothetical protein
MEVALAMRRRDRARSSSTPTIPGPLPLDVTNEVQARMPLRAIEKFRRMIS